jgi:hypothetical protein
MIVRSCRYSKREASACHSAAFRSSQRCDYQAQSLEQDRHRDFAERLPIQAQNQLSAAQASLNYQLTRAHWVADPPNFTPTGRVKPGATAGARTGGEKLARLRKSLDYPAIGQTSLTPYFAVLCRDISIKSFVFNTSLTETLKNTVIQVTCKCSPALRRPPTRAPLGQKLAPWARHDQAFEDPLCGAADEAAEKVKITVVPPVRRFELRKKTPFIDLRSRSFSAACSVVLDHRHIWISVRVKKLQTAGRSVDCCSIRAKNNKTRAEMRWLGSIIVVCGIAVGCLAQSAPAGLPSPADDPSSKPVTATIFPDVGYLSPVRYTNRYFGFSFDFPAEAQLHSVARPMATDGSAQLLELVGPAPDDGSISIVAVRQEKDGPSAKLVMRRTLDRDLYVGVEELRPLSKTSIHGREIYYFETRRGIEQHMLLATELDGYVLEFTLAAHNDKLLKRMEAGVQKMEFFAPIDYREHITADAREYEGPAISFHRLAQIEADPPVKHLDPGKITSSAYWNTSLGFNYRIPNGWVLESDGAIEPAVAQSRSQNTGKSVAKAESLLIDDCSRTLFSAWARRPGPDGLIVYDGFGEITLSALSLACFPGMEFPSNANDIEGFKAFLARFALTHPILQDMRDSKSFSRNGVIFLFLHGAVAFKAKDDTLSRRLSVAMAITERRGYILTWFFAAPHDSELQELLDARVHFDAETPVERAASKPAEPETVPGGGESTPQASNVPAPASAQTSQPANTTQTDSVDVDSQKQPKPADSPPSLLRQGETMDGQQGNGPVIQKH